MKELLLQKMLVVLGVVLFIMSCSVLQKITVKSAEKISQGVLLYCAEVDEQTRLIIRQQVNQKLNNRATIEVNCISL